MPAKNYMGGSKKKAPAGKKWDNVGRGTMVEAFGRNVGRGFRDAKRKAGGMFKPKSGGGGGTVRAKVATGSGSGPGAGPGGRPRARAAR